MLYVAAIFLVFAVLILVGNIAGCVEAHRHHGHYSNIPFLSLIFSALAWVCGSSTFGLWAFLPAALDPGTWMLAALPFCLIRQSGKRDGGGE